MSAFLKQSLYRISTNLVFLQFKFAQDTLISKSVHHRVGKTVDLLCAEGLQVVKPTQIHESFFAEFLASTDRQVLDSCEACGQSFEAIVIDIGIGEIQTARAPKRPIRNEAHCVRIQRKQTAKRYELSPDGQTAQFE